MQKNTITDLEDIYLVITQMLLIFKVHLKDVPG